MNSAASKLGKMAKGVPKNYTRAERNRRRKLMLVINQRRAKMKRGKIAGNSHQRRKARRQ